MTIMTAAPTRRRRRSGVRLSDRPQPCQGCAGAVSIVFGRQLQEDGSILMHGKGPRAGKPYFVPLAADPEPMGEWLYVRGPAARPVVRWISDEYERLTADSIRYREHRHTIRSES